MIRRHFYIVAFLLSFVSIFTGVKIANAVTSAPLNITETSSNVYIEDDIFHADIEFPVVIEETEPPVTYLDCEAGTYRYTYTCSNGLDMQYIVKIPKNATTDMPLILSLHGQGEVGKPSKLKDNSGVIKVANEINEERFIIVQPCATYGWHVEEQIKMVFELLDALAEQYTIDQNRVILTGHSLGALGTWYYGEYYTDKWAAIAPVSNKSTVKFDNLLNSKMPVWAFWSNWDVNSNVYGMRNAVEQLQDANPDIDIRGTEVRDVSHHNMSYAPYTQEFFDWAINQTRE